MNRIWLRCFSMRRSAFCKILMWASFVSTPSYAELRIGGFGTIGYTFLATASDDSIDDVSGATPKGTMRNLTRFGLNINKAMTDSASIFFQVVANGANIFHGTDEGQQFRARATLAGLRLDIEDYSIMVGLLPSANFIISDYIQVGYGYHYVQPPKVYYRYADMESLTGLRVTRELDLGPINTNVIFTAGEITYDPVHEDGSAYYSRSSYTYNLHFENEYEDHLLRFGFVLMPTLSYARHFRTTQEFDNNGTQVGVEFEVIGGCRSSPLFAWGVAYKGTLWDNLELLSEFTIRDITMGGCYGVLEVIEKLKQRDFGSYMALGYSMGKFMPRLGFSLFDRSVDTAAATAYQTRDLPNGPLRNAVRSGIDKAIKERTAQKGAVYSAGLNYQVSSQIVLKTEIEHFVATESNVKGYYMPPDSSASIVHFSIDFVF